MVINKAFSATLIKSSEKGGWTYVVWPGSVDFFTTRGLVKVNGKNDGHPFQSSLWHWATGPINSQSRQPYDVRSGRKQAKP
jgi:hypothetical protein